MKLAAGGRRQVSPGLLVCVLLVAAPSGAQWSRSHESEREGAKLAGGAESAIEWAERVTQKQQQGDDVDGNAGRTKPPEPDATPQEHRTLTAGDLSYDFLSKMGFVPPPPPPPWGFNKKNGSTSEIEERIMRQLIPIADLPKVMLCDACGAIAHQISRKLRIADGGKKRGKLSELELLDVLESACRGQFAPYPQSEELGPASWDEYGVADLNATCASPPEISCWNSTKRLVGPGCAKTYEWQREKEARFGWLRTRIEPECERIVSDCGDGQGELFLYSMVRNADYNATKVAAQLCAQDCELAAREQEREAKSKYVDEYAQFSKRAQWAKELGVAEDLPQTAEDVAEAKAAAEARRLARRSTKKKKKKKKKKKLSNAN